jgi:tripartite-type tricarboxylate transporter receptor subunit TctC
MRVPRSAIDLSARALAVLLAAALLAPAPAAAQADFYKGKTIDMVISTGVGGGLDANARVVARHLADHIPGNPTIVPRNMPGAGHIRAANFVFSQAPKDGTVIATFIPVFVMAQVLDRSKGIQFDPANFNWLASTSSSNSTVYTWHTSSVKSVADAAKRDVLMGGTGAGSYTIIYPTIMNSVVGTRFKLVTGYQSTAEIGLAMERGEVEGRAGNNFNSLKAENAEWLASGKITLITQARSGISGPAAFDRPRQNGPGPPGPEAVLDRCGDRPAVRDLAGRAGRARGAAAQGVRRDDDGSGLSGGLEKSGARRDTGRGRQDPGRGRGSGPHPGRHRRQGKARDGAEQRR